MTTLEFLRTVYPEGPWALTAIAVDRKGIETRTFYPAQEQELLGWVKERDGRQNLYWHVNPVIRAVAKKAEREDIKEVCYLHVDIDPRGKAASLSEEQADILQLLKSPPKSVPPPSIVVFSGGGYQAFWKLSEPIPINGELARAEDAKRYNMQLEVVFGADNCHNIDRLCRLPGTINVPDERKRKKGREPVRAAVVLIKPERAYALSGFIAAPIVQTDPGFSNSVRVSAPTNVKRLESVEELNEWSVPDRAKVIIVQGHMPDEPKDKDNSRSAWLFEALCSMARCNVPDEVMYAVITDPDFLVSASVLDKGSGSERYALRQIERAKEEAIDPWLRKLNERHAVISNVGGKCRIVEEVNDPALGRSRLTRQSFEDFCNRYMNVVIVTGTDKSGKDLSMPVGRWWLRHPQRRQYDTIVFAPGRDVEGAYNLWKGFACEAKPGDCSLFLEHVRANICSGRLDHYKYLMGWMARAVQHPDSPGQVAIVMRGRQGVGKSFFAKTFGGLFGRHFMQVADPKHLVGSFNAHLRDTVVLFGDEAFYAGDKKHESVLKMLITEELITIESKGIDAEAAPNYTHVLLASNNQWVVPAGADERRFFVLDVHDQNMQQSSYFGRIIAQLDAGGREALLHTLLNYDLAGYEVRSVPKTAALQEQKILSLQPEEEWWYRKLVNGRLLETHDEWADKVAKEDLLSDYISYMKAINVSRRSNETTLGRFLHRVCPGLETVQARGTFRVATGDAGWTREVKRRAYYWLVPPVAICRSRWADVFGINGFEAVRELPGVVREAEKPPF